MAWSKKEIDFTLKVREMDEEDRLERYLRSKLSLSSLAVEVGDQVVFSLHSFFDDRIHHHIAPCVIVTAASNHYNSLP